MAKFIRRYTLCNVDCSEFGHHAGHKTCARCGADIHKTIFEVEVDGVILTVGDECFKDLMGYKFNQSHAKALEVAAAMPEGTYFGAIRKSAILPIHYLPNGLTAPFPFMEQVELPHNLTATIIRAGEDLGLWEGRTDRYWKKGVRV